RVEKSKLLVEERILAVYVKILERVLEAFVEIIDCSAALFKRAHEGFYQFISLISCQMLQYVEQWMKCVCLPEEEKTNVGFRQTEDSHPFLHQLLKCFPYFPEPHP
nr:hypothetical protein [Tanacetum cinerariifolium]